MEFMKSLEGISMAVTTAIIVGLIQVLKPIIPNSKWYGVMAILFGVAFTLMISWALQGFTPITVVLSIINGTVAGLAASGAYSNKQTWQDKVTIPKEELEKLKECSKEATNVNSQ